MRLLIFGAGVIGSLYGAMLAEAGYDVSVYTQAFRLLPTPLVEWILGFVFQSSFGDRFMYRHSMKAPDEMRQLHEQLYRWLE